MPSSSSSSSIHLSFPHSINKTRTNSIMRSQPKSSPSSNGPSKKESIAAAAAVKYTECQKNHAASIGGYAVDGCREFMASGEEGTAAALRCAACNCHRSFHKREVDGQPPYMCDCSSDSNSTSTSTSTSSSSCQ